MSNLRIDERGNIIIEDGQVMFKNFAGRETDYNAEGKRNFCVVIDDPKAVDDLTAAGWNIRPARKTFDEGEPVKYVLKVNISYKYRGPKIFRKIGTAPNAPMFEVFEDTIADLDQDYILSADMTIAPSKWARNGKEGTSGYLQNMYATIETDAFYDKYHHNDMDLSAPAEFPSGTK